MRSKGFEGMVCPIAAVMAAIGDRWGMLILRDLVLGLRRYEDFRKSSGVTNATLSDRLKHLEANDLVDRSRYQTNPERFEYRLTAKGRQAALAMSVFAQIGDSWKVAGEAGPALRFVNRSTGADVALRFVDQDTGRELSPTDIALEAGSGADDLMRWRLSLGALRQAEADQVTRAASASAD